MNLQQTPQKPPQSLLTTCSETSPPNLITKPPAGHTQTNTPSSSVSNCFAAEFGGEETIQQLRDLESRSSQIFRLQLEKITSIQCSILTRHLWSHCQGIHFEKKEDLLKWCQENTKVEIFHKGLVISPMKPANWKDCKLCIQARINLF